MFKDRRLKIILKIIIWVEYKFKKNTKFEKQITKKFENKITKI